MMEFAPGSTSTGLIAAASEVLSTGGYQAIRQTFADWDTPTSRLFENEYNIVGIVVFETCAELLRAWPDRQGSLVNLMSQNVGQGESKTWDGYLVLLSPSLAPSEGVEIEAVRYNTTRLRKIVATGEDLQTAGDVEQVLRSLLPLSQEQVGPGRGSALDLLPRLLAVHGIPEETTRCLTEAFREQLPLMEQLHEHRSER